jgi:L-asparagine transporter-like permease
MKYDVYASSEFDFSSSESGEIRNTDKTSSNGFGMFTIYIIAIFPTIAVTTSIIRSSGIFRFLTDLVMFII